jgi:hypothetical protein
MWGVGGGVGTGLRELQKSRIFSGCDRHCHVSARLSGDSGRWSPERTVYGIAYALIERRGVGQLGLGTAAAIAAVVRRFLEVAAERRVVSAGI